MVKYPPLVKTTREDKNEKKPDRTEIKNL